MPVTETFTDFKLSFDIIVPDTAAVIVAAGSSSRMGGTPKQLMNLAGVPVIMRTALAFERCDRIRDILLVAREEEIPLLQRLCDEYRITKLTDIVPGGATRARSVQNGIARCRDCAYVAIHDGARPLVSGEVILRAIEGAERVGAAAAAVGLKDTVKQAGQRRVCGGDTRPCDPARRPDAADLPPLRLSCRGRSAGGRAGRPDR